MVDKHPSFSNDPLALARIYGQKAFAYAALGDREQARHWAREALRRSRTEKRAYVALAVSRGLIKPERVMALANAAGRGV
jgi:Tfp pilus assembly protein PilF